MTKDHQIKEKKIEQLDSINANHAACIIWLNLA